MWKWRGQDQLWLQTSGKVHHLHGRTNGRTSKGKTLWISWRTSNDEMYVFPNISIASFEQVLENSYLNSLKLMKENNLRTIAFPSISTGIYGFPHVNGSFNPANDWFSLYSVLVLYSLFLMLARIFLIRSLRATWLFEWSDTSWRGTKILWTGSGKKEDFFSSFVFRLSSVFTLGRLKPSTRRGCISCSQLKPKTTLNWCGANIRENITH